MDKKQLSENVLETHYSLQGLIERLHGYPGIKKVGNLVGGKGVHVKPIELEGTLYWNKDEIENLIATVIKAS